MFKSTRLACAGLLLFGAALTACSDDDSSDGASDPAAEDSSASANGSLPSVGERTIGIVHVTSQSEVGSVLVDNLETAIDAVGWSSVVKDGDATPQRWSTSIDELVAQNVDAIIVSFAAPTAVSASIQSARDAGVPVIYTGGPVTEAESEIVDGAYFDDFGLLFTSLAEYALENYGDDVTAVVQRASVNPGIDEGVAQFGETIEAAGGEVLDERDLDSANLVESFEQNATDMLNANPDADVLVECCDNSVTFVLPVLGQTGHEDVPLLTIYDTPSTIAVLGEGANLVIAAANTDRINLQALDVLLDFFVNGTEIPDTYPDDDFQVQVIDAETATGEPVFPFEPQLQSFLDQWSTEYAISQ